MTDKELTNAIVSLAESVKETNPLAAGVLFNLAGAVTAGPEWLRRTFDVSVQESARFIQFVTGEGEQHN